MKGGTFIDLVFDPTYFTFTKPPRKVAMVTLLPANSAISPHSVIEGSGSFEIVVEGAGFMGSSLVQVDGVSVPTAFVNPRTLKEQVPTHIVESAAPEYFGAHGPPQEEGVMADRIAPITVYTPLPESGKSNPIYLQVRAKWLAAEE